MDKDNEVRVTLQKLARHQMITHLYRDILVDFAVCDVEGWDKTEYIRELQDLLNSFKIGSNKYGKDKC